MKILLAHAYDISGLTTAFGFTFRDFREHIEIKIYVFEE